jgi:hypothetical protein
MDAARRAGQTPDVPSWTVPSAIQSPAHARRQRLGVDPRLRGRGFPSHRPRSIRDRRGHRQFHGLVHRAGLRRRRDPMGGFTVVNTMGTLDARRADRRADDLSLSSTRRGASTLTRRRCCWISIERVPDFYLSIELGGMLVLAGSAEAFAEAEARLPAVARPLPDAAGEPRRLPHAASGAGRRRAEAPCPKELFRAPSLPSDRRPRR